MQGLHLSSYISQKYIYHACVVIHRSKWDSITSVVSETVELQCPRMPCPASFRIFKHLLHCKAAPTAVMLALKLITSWLDQNTFKVTSKWMSIIPSKSSGHNFCPTGCQAEKPPNLRNSARGSKIRPTPISLRISKCQKTQGNHTE